MVNKFQEKIREAAKNFGWKVSTRKARDLENGFKIAILLGCFAILLIVFCFDAKWIEKFHVSATVVVAAVACMLQYSTRQERKLKARESSIMKFCEGIVAIIHDDKIMEQEEFHLNFLETIEKNPIANVEGGGTAPPSHLSSDISEYPTDGTMDGEFSASS